MIWLLFLNTLLVSGTKCTCWYTNNECLWVQWYKCFHVVKDGMFHLMMWKIYVPFQEWFHGHGGVKNGTKIPSLGCWRYWCITIVNKINVDLGLLLVRTKEQKFCFIIIICFDSSIDRYHWYTIQASYREVCMFNPTSRYIVKNLCFPFFLILFALFFQLYSILTHFSFVFMHTA